MGFDFGCVQNMVGFGGFPEAFADITHAGWLPKEFFAASLGPGAGDYVLAVTFTFAWVDSATGEATDIDHDGKWDVAFREIYYNNNEDFVWDVDAYLVDEMGPFDVESVALHEVGHGLSQGHFGMAFGTLSNRRVHFAPRAVMNAMYSGPQQELTKTDLAGHCSIWVPWPNE